VVAAMMKVLLIGLLLLIAVFVMGQRSVSRALRFAVLAMLGGGGYLVWLPERATALAKVLGVGRGADLLLYIWVVITLAVILLIFLKIVESNRMITALARQIALDNPQLPSAHPPTEKQKH
jgi:small membrane protein